MMQFGIGTPDHSDVQCGGKPFSLTEQSLNLAYEAWKDFLQ